MKIAITGYSGHIGKQLLLSNQSGFEFKTLGRSNADVYWKLGILPDPAHLADVDLIVHLAWATTNRKINFHTNVGGTIQLANLAKDLGCPFLFISSVGVSSESLYGKSKYLAEKGVIEARGKVVRLGLMPTTNRYLDSKKHFFAMFPQFKTLIPVTEFDSFYKFFIEWANESVTSGNVDAEVVTLVDSNQEFASLINSKFQIPIPEKIFGLGLKTFRKLSYRIDDVYDGFETITTRKNIN